MTSTSPIITSPGLPYETRPDHDGDSLRVAAYPAVGVVVAIRRDDEQRSAALLDRPSEAPALAAAILAAAGLDTYAVVDLGGPLPAVTDTQEGALSCDGGIYSPDVDVERRMDGLRRLLALAVHRAEQDAKPKHDPERIAKVRGALERLGSGRLATDAQAALILDALEG